MMVLMEGGEVFMKTNYKEGVTKGTNKNRKKKIPWWGKVLIIILCLIIGFLSFSVITIRHFVGDSLTMRGTLAMAGYGGKDLPAWYQKMVLGGERDYEGLPELLIDGNGKEVTTEEEYQQRKKELLDLYKKYMYGEIPSKGYTTSFEVVESGTALDGAAIRQQVKITVATETGSVDTMMLVYIPADAEETDPCKMFVGLNFSGNTTVWNDENILPSASEEGTTRGSDSEAWPLEDIISADCGIATMSYNDWAADNADTYRERLLSLFDDEKEYTAYSAWAFGIMRGVDYLYSMDGVNKEAIASVGHSRLARVSLWAGANDERISLVTAGGGGGYLRTPLSAKITRDGNSDHWFTQAYFDFEGKETEIPVDTNIIYALIANRHLFVSTGDSDLASDPVSCYDALQNAKVIWSDIYGEDVIDDGTYWDIKTGEPVISESVAFLLHKGAHQITIDDWKHYLEYINQYL